MGRRKIQQKTVKDQKKIAHEKLLSRVLSKAYLSKLGTNTFKILTDQGVLRNPLNHALNSYIMPNTIDNAFEEYKSKESFMAYLDVIAENTYSKLTITHKAH